MAVTYRISFLRSFKNQDGEVRKWSSANVEVFIAHWQAPWGRFHMLLEYRSLKATSCTSVSAVRDGHDL